MDEVNQKLFERIEAFLDGRMSPEEQISFEVKLKAEPELAAEVELQQTLRNAVEAGSLKEKLEAIHETHFAESEKGVSGFSAWKIAATVLVILGIGALLVQNSSSEERLFAEYVTTDPGLPVTMGTNDEYAFSDGMISYKEGQYQDALSTWETITSNEIDSDKLAYYRACAHFNLEEYKQALPFLTGLINEKQSDFHDRAVWYACLAYLQLKQNQEILSLSPTSSSPYYDRIESIKQELSE